MAGDEEGGAPKQGGEQPVQDPAAQRIAARRERSEREPGGKTGLGLKREAGSEGEGRDATDSNEKPFYLNRNLWLALAAVGVLTILIVDFMIPVGDAAKSHSTPAWVVWVLLLSALVIGGYVFIAEREHRSSGSASAATPSAQDSAIVGAKTARSDRNAAAFRESSGALASGLGLDETLEVILSAAVGLLEGTEGSIMLLDTDEQHLETICYRGDPGRYEPFARVKLGEGIAGKVAQSRKGIAITGPADPDQFKGLVEKEVAIDSAICVPLVAKGKLIGVLSVSDTVGGRSFDESDLASVEVFANDAAAAIVHSVGVR